MSEVSPQPDMDPSARIASAFTQLTESAKHANKAKMQLARPVGSLLNAIRKLDRKSRAG